MAGDTEYKCPDCWNTEMTEQQVGKHIGIYCSECGKWIKWKPQNKDWRSFVMPFGKHAGKKLADIAGCDYDYLKWGSVNLSGNIQRKFAAAVLESNKCAAL